MILEPSGHSKLIGVTDSSLVPEELIEVQPPPYSNLKARSESQIIELQVWRHVELAVLQAMKVAAVVADLACKFYPMPILEVE